MIRSDCGHRVKLALATASVLVAGLVVALSSQAWALGTQGATPALALSSDTQIDSSIGVVDTQTLTITLVPYATTAHRLMDAVSAYDDSVQTYTIVRGSDVVTPTTTALETGDTLIVIAEDGVTRADYAIGVLSASETPVDFPDAVLDTVVRDAIGMPTGQIFASDLATLTVLTAQSADAVASLEGLQYATNLTTLALGGNHISDISPLSGLTGLTTLDLEGNEISDVTPLSGLVNLTDLELSGNQITDITPLSGLTNLTTLGLGGILPWHNDITDIAVVGGFTNLTSLDLSWNQITDISPLSGLTDLTSLELNDNGLADIGPLSELTKLTTLSLSGNHIVSVAPLGGLTNLQELYLGAPDYLALLNEHEGNNISDIGPLRGLTDLRLLDLGQNYVSSVAPLSGLTRLNYLDLGSNDITDIGPLSGLWGLNYLYLNDNHVTDVSALDGLYNLLEVYLNDNEISDVPSMTPPAKLSGIGLANNRITDISPLSGLSLVLLDVSNNRISDISSLSEQVDLGYLRLDHNHISDISALNGLAEEGTTNLSLLTLAYNDLDVSIGSPSMATIATLTASGATVTYLPQNGGVTTIQSTLGSVDNTACTITVPHGTTADQLAAALSSTNESTQTYSVYRADGTTPRTGVLVNGDKLIVLSQDGSARQPYSIRLTYALIYRAGWGGSIGGATSQVVVHGSGGAAVTADADPGYHFVRWSDGVLTATRTDRNVTADHDVTAVFAIYAYRITPIAAAHGTISPSTARTVDWGGSLTFKFKPAVGYHISAVKADKASLAATSSYTFRNVVADHTISATFAWTKLETTVTITSSETTVTRGKTVTLSGTIAPNMANGTHVAVQVRKSGSNTWTTLSTRRTYRHKHWSYRYTIPKTHARGTYYLRAHYAGSATYKSSISTSRKLVIR